MRKFFRRIRERVSAWFKSIPLVKFFIEEPTEKSIGEALISLKEDKRAWQSFLEHFEAVRRHLGRSLAALLVATVIGWFLTEPVVTLLAASIGGPQNLQAIDLTESIGVYMKIAVLLGLCISIPYIAFEFWFFAAPGLKPRQRLISMIGIPLAALFFYLGVLFTYRYMLPPAINFLMNFGEFTSNPTAEKYYNLLTRLLFWIGLFFEFPFVVYILTDIGFIKPQQLAQQWRIAIIVIAVIAAVITPTTDMGSMALVMAPMIVLYIIGVLLSYVASAARKRRADTSM